MAKLPPSRIKSSDPALGDIMIGDVVFVTPFDMKADTEAVCFLNPKATFQEQKSLGHALRVSRAGDGFHVAILAAHQWVLESLPPSFSQVGLRSGSPDTAGRTISGRNEAPGTQG
jgi:hypothetical protein